MGLLDIILIILLISWIGGFALKIGGSTIHAILVIILVVLFLRLLGVNI